MNYVVGFLFRAEGAEVALIMKKRPAWQAGLINGVGGKMEPNEPALDAMRREFKEETGSPINDWEQFATIVGDRYTIHCFCSFEKAVAPLKSVTDEEVDWYAVHDLPGQPLENDLRWLIPMALSGRVSHAQVQTK